MSSFRAEARVYFDHVAALLLPGRKVKEHNVVSPQQATVGDLGSWSDDDLILLIEECRLTLASQETRFDRVRTTAQVVLPLTAGILVVIGSQLRGIVAVDAIAVRLLLVGGWIAATGCVLAAALGAAATLTVRSEFGMIFPPLLSQFEPPIRPKLASEYASQVATGERTIGTRITIIRDAVALLAIGGVAYLVLWLPRVLF